MRTFFVAVLVVVVCTPIAFARKWTDATGKHTVEAELVESKDGTVRLKKGNGQIISLSLEKLSDADQEYVRSKINGAGFALAGPRTEEADPDSDADGLPDFQEVHKYRTNPKNRDTAGKGVSDGEWQQRREFTYSVRAVIRVMRPYNVKTLNDDYQDVRVLTETEEYAELEVVVYPLNSNAEAIKGNSNWKKDDAGMEEYLAPGITTNWDDEMRKDLLRELGKDGIDPNKLTDKEVVEQVSRWLFKHSKCLNMFDSYYIGFQDGKPVVLPGLEKAFERDKGDPNWTVQQQFDHELYGKNMFANKTCGTCTSTAIYQTTLLRALGVPTRMILCIPLADGSDHAQVKMVEKGLTHHQVLRDAYLALTAGGKSFIAHTFCEVFVGGRWRRLNYTTLGQNVLDQKYLGLMIKVHTFNDLSEANLAATWGTRYAKGLRDDVFNHSNPYCLLDVRDHFGEYGNVPNPPAAAYELVQVTIEKAYWPESKDAPQMVREQKSGAEPGGSRFYIHCREWLENAGEYLQYKRFMSRADKNFILRTEGRPDVLCHLSTSNVAGGTDKLRELEVVIPPAEYAKMAQGVAYTLHPVNAAEGYVWNVSDGLVITRDEYSNVPNPPAAEEHEKPQQAFWFSAGPGWKELGKTASSRGYNLSSFNHTAAHYQMIMSKSQPGSMVVLLFALDHKDKKIPEQYQDLLPVPWTQIEAALKEGKTVERAGKARERKIVLLAAPTESQLNELIHKTQLLSPNPPNK